MFATAGKSVKGHKEKWPFFWHRDLKLFFGGFSLSHRPCGYLAWCTVQVACYGFVVCSVLILTWSLCLIFSTHLLTDH